MFLVKEMIVRLSIQEKMEVIAHHSKQQEVMRHLYLELGKTKQKKIH